MSLNLGKKGDKGQAEGAVFIGRSVPIGLSEGDNPKTSLVEILWEMDLLHEEYGRVQFSALDIETVDENIRKNVRRQKIPVIVQHDRKSGAYGWLADSKIETREGKKVLFAAIEWTPRGIEAIRNREFLYISPSIARSYTDPETGETFENVLVEISLTVLPAKKGQKELTLALSEGEDANMIFLGDLKDYRPTEGIASGFRAFLENPLGFVKKAVGLSEETIGVDGFSPVSPPLTKEKPDFPPLAKGGRGDLKGRGAEGEPSEISKIRRENIRLQEENSSRKKREMELEEAVREMRLRELRNDMTRLTERYLPDPARDGGYRFLKKNQDKVVDLLMRLSLADAEGNRVFELSEAKDKHPASLRDCLIEILEELPVSRMNFAEKGIEFNEAIDSLTQGEKMDLEIREICRKNGWEYNSSEGYKKGFDMVKGRYADEL